MKKKTLVIIIVCIALASILAIGIVHICNKVADDKLQAERKKIVEDYYNNKIAQYTEENKTLASVDVAFIGDSLTDGYNLGEYYPQYSVVNRGIGGDTTFGVEKRLKVSLYDISPKVVVMLIGGNNLDTMMNNYESILQQLQSNLPSSKIVLLSLTAMGRDWAYKNSQAIVNNQQIKSLANKYGFTFVDLFTPLYNVETGEIYAEYTTDGAHFTSQGYTVVTNTVTPVLQTLLGK